MIGNPLMLWSRGFISLTNVHVFVTQKRGTARRSSLLSLANSLARLVYVSCIMLYRLREQHHQEGRRASSLLLEMVSSCHDGMKKVLNRLV